MALPADVASEALHMPALRPIQSNHRSKTCRLQAQRKSLKMRFIDKYEFIRQFANFFISTGTSMNAKDLAGLLNWNGFKTDYGSTYAGARGTYKLIHATYDW